jgi:hypothetical protein
MTSETLDVQSRRVVERIQSESFRLLCPQLTNPLKPANNLATVRGENRAFQRSPETAGDYLRPRQLRELTSASPKDFELWNTFNATDVALFLPF